MCFWPGLAQENQDDPVPISGVLPNRPEWPVPLHAVDVSQEKAPNAKWGLLFFYLSASGSAHLSLSSQSSASKAVRSCSFDPSTGKLEAPRRRPQVHSRGTKIAMR